MVNTPSLPNKIRFKHVFNLVKAKMLAANPQLESSDFDNSTMAITYTPDGLSIVFTPNPQKHYVQQNITCNIRVNLSLFRFINTVLINGKTYHNSQYEDIIAWLPDELEGVYNENDGSMLISKRNVQRPTVVTETDNITTGQLYVSDIIPVTLSRDKVDLVSIITSTNQGTVKPMLAISDLDYIEPRV